MKSFTLEQIVDDWQSHFPDLKKYTSAFLAKKAGFLIVGLRIDRSVYGTGDYRIYYEAYPIWRNRSEIVRRSPILYVPLLGEKGFIFEVYNSLHDYYIEQASESAKIQFGPLLSSPMKASALVKSLNKALSGDNTSYEMCCLFSLKLALGCYLNDRELTEVATKEIERFIQREVTDKRVSQSDINYIYGWKSEMYALFENREQFMQIIEEHSHFPKVARLNQTDIINDLPELRELRKHAPKPPIHKRFWDWFLGRKKIEYSF